MANEKEKTPAFDVKLKNAEIKVKKQDVIEDGKVIKSLYYMVITTEKGTMNVNVGEKTYNEVNKLTNK